MLSSSFQPSLQAWVSLLPQSHFRADVETVPSQFQGLLPGATDQPVLIPVCGIQLLQRFLQAVEPLLSPSRLGEEMTSSTDC